MGGGEHSWGSKGTGPGREGQIYQRLLTRTRTVTSCPSSANTNKGDKWDTLLAKAGSVLSPARLLLLSWERDVGLSHRTLRLGPAAWKSLPRSTANSS